MINPLITGYIAKVLPAVYDDSLSYYELLSKILQKLNEMVTEINGIPQLIVDEVGAIINGAEFTSILNNLISNVILSVKNPPLGMAAAYGDGTHNDGAAIQACIDYAVSGGKCVYFPNGVYLTNALTLKNGVSLKGAGKYNSRLVLAGGATIPLLSGTTSTNEIRDITLDGNAEIQVNNLDLVSLSGTNYSFSDAILTGGVNLLNLTTTTGCANISNVDFSRATEKACKISGAALVTMSNCSFDYLSAISGVAALDIATSNGFFTNLQINATCPNALIISGNNNKISAHVAHAANLMVDSGSNNSIESIGKEKHEKISGAKTITAATIELNATNALKYKTPTAMDAYFKTIPFTDGNAPYDVLVKTAETHNIFTLIGDVATKTALAANSNILTVAKTGGRFTTINAAIDYAKTYCSLANRVTILIGAGTYNEAVTLMPNTGIDFIGAGAGATIIESSAEYPNAPLYTVGAGTFKGIQFKSTAVSGAYGFHFESQVDPAEGAVYFYDCKFTSASHSGVGIGMGNNTSIYFINCVIETTKSTEGAFYAHNFPNASAANQFLYVYNCYITNQAGGVPVRIENAFTIAGGTGAGSTMYISFAGTTARLQRVTYKRGATDILKFVPSSSDNIVLLDSSEGTNILGLDYFKNRPLMGGYFYCAGNGVATIPYPEGCRYAWAIEEVRDTNGTDITSTCTIGVSDKNYIQIITTTESVKNNALNATIRGMPLY